jgi:hypothetical protein
MKYLIKESQIDRMIGKYLDFKDFKIIDSKYGIFFAYSESDSWAQMRYIDPVNTLIINADIYNEVEKLFGLDQEYSRIKDTIGDWVSEKLNVNVDPSKITIYSGMMADANLSM